MVEAGTRVTASVAGAFDYLKAPETLESFASQQLARFGSVVSVKVSTAMFSGSYVARVVYVTGQAHRSVEDIRATVAGIFQSWNGLRPAVSIVEPAGEPEQGAAASPFLPAGFDLAKYAGLLWAVVALVVVVNLAPAFRR